MAAHIQTLETQGSVLARRLGGGMPPRACEGQPHELPQHAIVLDKRCGENQAARRRGSANNMNRDNNCGGRGRGRDSGRGRGGGRGGRGRGRGGGRTSDRTDDCAAPEKWAATTPKERCDHIQTRQKKTQINSSNQSQGDGDAPPTTTQAQTQQQSQQGQQQNPGSMIRNVMSQSSQ